MSDKPVAPGAPDAGLVAARAFGCWIGAGCTGCVGLEGDLLPQLPQITQGRNLGKTEFQTRAEANWAMQTQIANSLPTSKISHIRKPGYEWSKCQHMNTVARATKKFSKSVIRCLFPLRTGEIYAKLAILTQVMSLWVRQ